MFYIHTIAGAGAYAEICCARDGGPGQPNVAKCKWNETEILAKNRAKRRRWIERKARVINSRQHHYYLRLYSQLLLNSAILSTCVMGFTLEAGDGNDEWALEIAIKCKSRYLGHLLIQENPNINFYFPPQNWISNTFEKLFMFCAAERNERKKYIVWNEGAICSLYMNMKTMALQLFCGGLKNNKCMRCECFENDIRLVFRFIFH